MVSKKTALCLSDKGVLSLFNISKETSGFYICTSSNKIRSATCNLTLAVMPRETSLLLFYHPLSSIIDFNINIYLCLSLCSHHEHRLHRRNHRWRRRRFDCTHHRRLLLLLSQEEQGGGIRHGVTHTHMQTHTHTIPAVDTKAIVRSP